MFQEGGDSSETFKTVCIQSNTCLFFLCIRFLLFVSCSSSGEAQRWWRLCPPDKFSSIGNDDVSCDTIFLLTRTAARRYHDGFPFCFLIHPTSRRHTVLVSVHDTFLSCCCLLADSRVDEEKSCLSSHRVLFDRLCPITAAPTSISFLLVAYSSWQRRSRRMRPSELTVTTVAAVIEERVRESQFSEWITTDIGVDWVYLPACLSASAS